MKRFKVGDKVRIVGNIGDREDLKALVFEVDTAWPKEEHYLLKHQYNEYYYEASGFDLELVDTKVKKTYVIGDVVVLQGGLKYRVDAWDGKTGHKDFLTPEEKCSNDCPRCKFYNAFNKECSNLEGCHLAFYSMDELTAFVEKHQEKPKFKVGEVVTLVGGLQYKIVERGDGYVDLSAKESNGSERCLGSLCRECRYKDAFKKDHDYGSLVCTIAFKNMVELASFVEKHQEKSEDKQVKEIKEPFGVYQRPKAPQSSEVQVLDLTKLNLWYEIEKVPNNDCPKCNGTGVSYYYPLLKIRTWGDKECDCVKKVKKLYCKELPGKIVCFKYKATADHNVILWDKLTDKMLASYKFSSDEQVYDFYASIPNKEAK